MPVRKGPKPKKSVKVKKSSRKPARKVPQKKAPESPLSRPAGSPGAVPSPDEVL